MSTQNQSTFTKEKDDTFTVFDVHPAKMGGKPIARIVAFTFMGLICVTPMVTMATNSISTGFFSACVFVIVCDFLFYKLRFNDKRECAVDSRFKVNTSMISRKFPYPGGIDAKSIDRLVIRNSMTGTSAEVTPYRTAGINPLGAGIAGEYVAGTSSMPGVVGGAVGSVAAMGNVAATTMLMAHTAGLNALERSEAKYKNKMAETSFVLEAHVSGKVEVLAGGMDENTAYGLMRSVSRAMEGG